jgi:hypothetical protein
MSRYRVFSLIAGGVVAAVALSPSAYADDDLFTPTEPSIVVGGTVHPPGTIVVDPETPAAATGPGPIDASKPIEVDPRVRVAPPAPPICCGRTGGATVLIWPGRGANPPVFQVENRFDGNLDAYLDNHGRYWLFNHQALTLEQVGGWPEPPPGPKILDPLPRGYID